MQQLAEANNVREVMYILNSVVARLEKGVQIERVTVSTPIKKHSKIRWSKREERFVYTNMGVSNKILSRRMLALFGVKRSTGALATKKWELKRK